jgi:hypothetical protein
MVVEYKNILEEFVLLTLEEGGSNDVLFQQDGTPSNFHIVVLEFVNRKFPWKLIARG